MRKALLTWAAGLGFAGAVLGLIWLLGIREADRWWGAAAIVIGIFVLVAVWRASRNSASATPPGDQ